jgi:hypothetical protein
MMPKLFINLHNSFAFRKVLCFGKTRAESERIPSRAKVIEKVSMALLWDYDILKRMMESIKGAYENIAVITAVESTKVTTKTKDL